MEKIALVSPEASLSHKDASTQPTDEALMLAYAQGDSQAFERLYDRHRLAVYRFFARQSLPTSVAEELSHDVWLKIIAARTRYTDTALFKTFLFSIARNRRH